MVMNPELGFCVVVTIVVVVTASTGTLVAVVLLQSAHECSVEVVMLLSLVLVLVDVVAASTGVDTDELLVQSAQVCSIELVVVLVVVAPSTGVDADELLVQSAQVCSIELVVLIVVVAMVVVVVFAPSTGVEADSLLVQSTHVYSAEALDALGEVVDTSMAAIGAVGLRGLISLGVAVTVMVLCTTSVTVTYETEHAPPSLLGPAGQEPAPVCTGISVIVSVVVDRKVMVVVASVSAAATLTTSIGP
jgi:hypothetical protein